MLQLNVSFLSIATEAEGTDTLVTFQWTLPFVRQLILKLKYTKVYEIQY